LAVTRYSVLCKKTGSIYLNMSTSRQDRFKIKKSQSATLKEKGVRLGRNSIALIRINTYFSGTNICYAATA
jgi:hypothetical protein